MERILRLSEDELAPARRGAIRHLSLRYTFLLGALIFVALRPGGAMEFPQWFPFRRP
jgi:hypothetical protein